MRGIFRSHVSANGAVKSVDDMSGASFYYDASRLRGRKPERVTVEQVYIVTPSMQVQTPERLQMQIASNEGGKGSMVIVVFVKRTCTHLGLRGLPYINSAVSPRSRPWKVGWKEGRVYFQVLIQEEYLSSVPHSVLA